MTVALFHGIIEFICHLSLWLHSRPTTLTIKQGDHEGEAVSSLERQIYALRVFFNQDFVDHCPFLCNYSAWFVFRVNAAWDYSVSPLKQEKQDAGECARNVLIALCEECPSADPFPILFLESEMIFEGGRKKQSVRAGEGGREKVGCSYSLETWKCEEFLIFLRPISKNP